MPLSEKVEKFIRANHTEFTENPHELEKILLDERAKAVIANNERFERQQAKEAEQHAKRVERMKEYYADTLSRSVLFPISEQDLINGHLNPLGTAVANLRAYTQAGGTMPATSDLEEVLFFLAIAEPQIMADENGSTVATIHPCLVGVTFETFWSFYTPCLEASGILDPIKIESIRSQLEAIRLGAKNVE